MTTISAIIYASGLALSALGMVAAVRRDDIFGATICLGIGLAAIFCLTLLAGKALG